MTRALVTGATGFIGRALAESLLREGWEITCPVRDLTRLRNAQGLNGRFIPLGSVYDELEKGPGYDYIFHLAGATREKDRHGYFKANVELTQRLLESVLKGASAKRLKRFLFVSSQAAAGPAINSGAPKKESDNCAPVSLYGDSKLQAEKVVNQYSNEIPVTIIRPPTVFGPRDTDVLTVFKMAKFRIQTIPTGPDRPVSVIYVKDLVNGLLIAATSQTAIGKTYFLSNPEPVIWREFCLDISRSCGKKAVIVRVPILLMKLIAKFGDLQMAVTGNPPLIRTEKLKEMLQPAWVCSSEPAIAELNWGPEYSVEKALEETSRWYRDNGWI